MNEIAFLFNFFICGNFIILDRISIKIVTFKLNWSSLKLSPYSTGNFFFFLPLQYVQLSCFNLFCCNQMTCSECFAMLKIIEFSTANQHHLLYYNWVKLLIINKPYNVTCWTMLHFVMYTHILMQHITLLSSIHSLSCWMSVIYNVKLAWVMNNFFYEIEDDMIIDESVCKLTLNTPESILQNIEIVSGDDGTYEMFT